MTAGSFAIIGDVRNNIVHAIIEANKAGQKCGFPTSFKIIVGTVEMVVPLEITKEEEREMGIKENWVTMDEYVALLKWATEMAKELRSLCRDDIHERQVDELMEMISKVRK